MQTKGKTLIATTATVGVIASAVALAATGSGQQAAEPGPPVVLVEKADCSISMRGVQPGLPGIAKRITVDSARPGSRLIAGTFAGNPGTSPDPWPIVERYQLDTARAGGNENLAMERLVEQGENAGKRVEKLMECPPGTRRRKTPLLSVLEDCAQALEHADAPRGVKRRVVIYTDGELIGDGIDARDGITVAQAEAAIRRFSPRRLAGLHGAHVWFIGTASGTNVDQPTMRRVESIVEHVIENADGELVSFAPSSSAYPFKD